MSLLGLSQQQSNSRKTVTGRYYFCTSKHFGEITNAGTVHPGSICYWWSPRVLQCPSFQNCKPFSYVFASKRQVPTETNGMQKGVDILAGVFFFFKSSQPPPKGQTQLRLWGKREINQSEAKTTKLVAIVPCMGSAGNIPGGRGRGEGEEEGQALPVPGGIGAGPLLLSPPLVQGSCLSLAQIAEAGRTHELQPAKSPHGQWVVRGG